MAKMQEVDRSLVVIFDIGGFTKSEPQTQVTVIDMFVEHLNQKLLQLAVLLPDAFSTGDGAIVSIGRNCTINKDTTKQFCEFVIDFVSQMWRIGLRIRAAINYSERDKILIIDHLDTIQGSYIQVGDTINFASRVLAFAEIGEILFNKSVYDLLRNVGLLSDYDFIKNESLTTKHGEVLETFSYKPRKEDDLYLYDPTCPEHQYKKYNYFPPISGDVVKFFTEAGLDYELNRIISSAFESIKDINTTRQFISRSTVINVLTQLNYDPEDKVYILNRQDRKATFWTQPAKRSYVRYLQSHAKRNNGILNQIRVRIYKSELEEVEPMPDEDIYWDVVQLHNPNTYFSVPSNLLVKFRCLNELIFGATVSVKHGYAIIPIPSPESMEIKLPPIINIGDALSLFQEYDIEHGPMNAIITANEAYIRELITEFQKIIVDPQTNKLK